MTGWHSGYYAKEVRVGRKFHFTTNDEPVESFPFITDGDASDVCSGSVY